MMGLLTRPKSSRLVRLHLRGYEIGPPGLTPRRYNTNGNAREGQVPRRRRGHQMLAIPALALTLIEARTRTHYSSKGTMLRDCHRSQRARVCSPIFLDKMGLARSALAAPSL